MAILAFLPPVPPFLFSALVVGSLASKALHIGLHFHSLPFLYLVLYSPTLILPELFIIAFVRTLLQFPAPESWRQWIPTCLGGFLSLITWGASSVQFGFFMQTGAEVAWAASNSFLSDPAAMKILLSGISTVSAAATVLGLVAWLIHAHLYNVTGLALQGMRELMVGAFRARRNVFSIPNKSWIASVELRSARRAAIVVSAVTSLLFLELSRPSIPYDHLSGALPLTLLDAFTKKTSTVEGCRNPSKPFPLWPVEKSSPDWSRASWLPQDPPPGFSRWDMSPVQRAEKDNPSYYLCSGDENAFFNPTADPLKISNLGGDIYEPLQKAFEEHSVEINNIVLLTLESGRKEMFPMQQGTPMFDSLIASHKEKKRNQAIDRLVKMTPIAQMLTGEYVQDSKGEKVDLSEANWQDPAEEGMGGLNVRGALTGSSLTFKSILGSHCGVHPLPVDLLEESMLEIYQPCLPQLLELFNQKKLPKTIEARTNGSTSEALQHQWKSVFMQSITDDYDRQDILDKNMGFKHKVVKQTMNAFKSKYKPKGEEINYFGYAETELQPYVRDLFYEAANNKTRVFLSHVTSTTHHPWGTPKNFEKERYMGSEGTANHDLMNNYLNAARFVDNWLGDVLNLLDETGIANSTLVVIVGDHGQAFGEDNKDMTGTYENGHISNFRVPLVFRHPHMPRIDITANATALTIIPTILDMLVQSNSLDKTDSEIASALLPEYQGQSLIRPFIPFIKDESESPDNAQIKNPDELEERAPHKNRPRTRHVWNFGLINAGGSMIAVTAAGMPYRLILPLREGFEYVFTHLDKDPGELRPIKAWTLSQLVNEVRSGYHEDAVEWLEEAEKVGKWWTNEQRRVWGYREA
ncbi:Alkaline phosphatase-like alpha/beta/alpha [Penicillium odoratum]|uniref:Alkaline phosphatase-like alpha/beta/alpha n=1 Tax=Penicillium odoratum TaxID=1167516 RepID=UPI002548C7F6|nr:Alkaline phosphatase-like alpha/beta/alpha [Penicillium odoratum]KAJ5778122.1 Alkaline phosphatase-like alpha/beta/alpha [Penicillium odoratum]